jgi:uncharacterized protein (DUF433 family)
MARSSELASANPKAVMTPPGLTERATLSADPPNHRSQAARPCSLRSSLGSPYIDVTDSEGGCASTRRAPGAIRSCKEKLRKGGDGVAFDRVTVDPGKMGGVPSIRGLRLPVATVVEMVADGMDEEEILKAYPDLEREDVREALRYAAEAVREREIPLV